MNLKELINRLPNHPLNVFEKGLGTKATEDSFYLYELHCMHNDWWESHIWSFSTIEEFVKFLPAIVFRDIIVQWEDLDEENDNYDYSKVYEFYQSLINKEWDVEKCIEFVNEYKNEFEDLELIEFGKISDLLSVAEDEYEKCKDFYDTLDELEELNLTQARYQIFHKFHDESESSPSNNKEVFLKMLEEFN